MECTLCTQNFFINFVLGKTKPKEVKLTTDYKFASRTIFFSCSMLQDNFCMAISSSCCLFSIFFNCSALLSILLRRASPLIKCLFTSGFSTMSTQGTHCIATAHRSSMLMLCSTKGSPGEQRVYVTTYEETYKVKSWGDHNTSIIFNR